MSDSKASGQSRSNSKASEQSRSDSKAPEQSRSDSKASAHSRLERTFFLHLSALATSAIALAAIDTLLTFSRTPENLTELVVYFIVTVAAGVWSAPLFAAVSVPTSLLLPPAAGARTLAFSLLLSVGCVLLMKPWDLAVVWPYWVVPLAGLVLGLVAYSLERTVSRRTFRLVLLCVGLLSLGLDAFAYRRLYLSLHHCLLLIAIVCLTAAVPADLRSRRLGTGLFVSALAAQGIWGMDLSAARSLGTLHGIYQPKLISAGQALLDFDGDGFSKAFAGGDCNDTDPTVHPGACERSNETLDRNCNGHAGPILTKASAEAARVAARVHTTPPDVYLFLVDTLRADYGGARRSDLAPEVERFSKTALDFDRAYTPYPSTFRAMISMAQSRSWRGISAREPDLLSRFVALGFDAELWIGERRLRAAADASLVHLDRTNGDPFFLENPKQKAPYTGRMVDEALKEAENQEGRPRFRWIHTLDPHQPLVLGQGGDRARYRAAVRHVSREFGRLVHGLERTARGRKSVVLFLSDHGEEQEDHGGRFHGATLYEENIRVPLLMRLPGVAPRRIDQPATLLDVLPTLLDYLGLGDSGERLQGRSHLSRDRSEHPVFSQIEPVKNLGGQGRPEMQAVILGDYKLIHNLTSNLSELYDLRSDPHERTNLLAREPSLARKLRAHLTEFQDGAECQSF